MLTWSPRQVDGLHGKTLTSHKARQTARYTDETSFPNSAPWYRQCRSSKSKRTKYNRLRCGKDHWRRFRSTSFRQPAVEPHQSENRYQSSLKPQRSLFSIPREAFQNFLLLPMIHHLRRSLMLPPQQFMPSAVTSTTTTSQATAMEDLMQIDPPMQDKSALDSLPPEL
jgi:hypothetical protein